MQKFYIFVFLSMLSVMSFSQTVPTPVLLFPANDTTMLKSDSTITFQWRKVTGSNLLYTIEVANSSNFDTVVYTTELNVGPDTITQYVKVDNKFSTGTNYYWRVKATDTAAGAYGQWSVVWRFTTRLNPPVFIKPTISAILDSNSVFFSWYKTDQNAKYFNLWYATDSNFTTGLVKRENLSDTILVVTGINSNTKYYYKVQSKNTTGVSLFSDNRFFTISNPCSIIEDGNIKITISHSDASINNITYKKGSGREIVNSVLNISGKKGLEKITNETGSILTSWTPSTKSFSAADTAIFIYSNSSYGMKKFVITWDSLGIEVKTYLYILAQKGPFTLGGLWKPGGDNSSIWDSLMVVNNNGVRNYYYIQYPGGTSSTLFSGKAKSVGIWDSRYDEMFGYKYPYDTSSVTVSNGISLDGPIFTLPKNTKSITDTVSYTFSIKKRANFLTWIGLAPIVIEKPAVSEAYNSSGDSVIIPINFSLNGVSGNLKVKFTSDNGLSWNFVKVISSTPLYDSTINFPICNSSSCRIKIEKQTDSTVFGLSEKFSVFSTNSVQFHLGKNIISSPGSRIVIPFTIKTSTSGISSFDARIQFNKNILTYLMDNSKSIFDITKWVVALTDSSKNGWIQLSGYAKNNAVFLDTNTATTVNFSFTVNSSTRVGVKEDITLNTKYLAAADVNATSQKIIGFNGNYSIYTKITGGLKYYARPFGLKEALVKFDFTNTNNDTTSIQLSDTVGYYSLTNVKPCNFVSINVDGKLIRLDTSAVITAADAYLAFQGRDGGTQALTGYQKIAADVNNDKVINSSDALAILKRSTSTIFNFENNRTWIFLDSTYNVNNGENWKTPVESISWGPVDSVKSNKSFIGIAFGDVNGSLAADTTSAVLKSVYNFVMEDPIDHLVTYSNIMLNKVASHKAGDTILIPISITPNGNKLISFNIKLEYEATKLKYLGEYSFGSSVPSGLGWVIDINSREAGAVYMGSANFGQTANPIVSEGVLLNLKFKINDNLTLLDSIQLRLNRLHAGNLAGASIPLTYSNGVIKISGVSDVNEDLLPKDYSISQNYPNPFNPSTKIKYSIPKESKVTITIFNSLGQSIQKIVNQIHKAGYYETEFNGMDLSSGIYFYRIDATAIENGMNYSNIKKMLLIK